LNASRVLLLRWYEILPSSKPNVHFLFLHLSTSAASHFLAYGCGNGAKKRLSCALLCVHISTVTSTYTIAAVFSSHADSLKKFRFAYLRNIYSLYCYHFYRWTHNDITLFVRNRTRRAWPMTSNLFLAISAVRYWSKRQVLALTPDRPALAGSCNVKNLPYSLKLVLRTTIMTPVNCKTAKIKISGR
jgi:hypothetical protein